MEQKLRRPGVVPRGVLDGARVRPLACDLTRPSSCLHVHASCPGMSRSLLESGGRDQYLRGLKQRVNLLVEFLVVATKGCGQRGQPLIALNAAKPILSLGIGCGDPA